ncbi:MAG: ATP-binding protein [Spirochaetota bacterium]
MTDDELKREHTRLTAAGEIAAIIFHDLRSPLSIIKGYIDMLALKEGDVSKEKLKEISLVLSQQIETINQMAADSACFRESSPLVKRPISVPHIIDLVKHSAPVNTSIADVPAVDIDVDASLIERSLSAIIRVLAGAGDVSVECRATDDAFSFVISAAGNATDDNLSKMFTPLFVYGKRRGAGLALMCAKKAVLDHGGHVLVEQKDGRMIVTVILPLH